MPHYGLSEISGKSRGELVKIIKASRRTIRSEFCNKCLFVFNSVACRECDKAEKIESWFEDEQE